jgi:RHS repeat-associated protein
MLGAATFCYFHTDHLGSIQVTANEVGTPQERLSYDIFGKRRNVNGTDDAGTITAGNNIKGASPRRGYTGHEMLDSLSLVHMNGRVYDPGLGRVLSADPIIQAPMMTQSYNRYSYVMNNPLALTDPSGYNWLTKGLRGLIFGVTSLIPAIGNRLDNFFANSKFGQFALSSILTFYGGSPGAALASAYLTAVQGGSDSDIFMAGLKTGATAFAFELAGGVGGGGEAGANSFGRYAAHAGAGCLSGYANGEGCGRGAASAVAGKFMTNGMVAAGFDKAQMFVGTVVAGGVTSALGGGKFANGAQTAAFGYLLNQLASRPQREMREIRNWPGGTEGPTISFVNDDPSGAMPPRLVDTRIADVVEQTALQCGCDITINSTTGGQHTSAAHPTGRAVDIYWVNGEQVSNNLDYATRVEVAGVRAFISLGYSGQVLGPAFTSNIFSNSSGTSTSHVNVGGHRGHIHIGVGP